MSDHDKDWKTPLPLTGKPETKTIYCWTRRCYITRTCILLGVRELPASVPYARRPGNGAPSPYARVDTPEEPKTPTYLRDKMLTYLRTNGPSTAQQVAAALGIGVDHAGALLARNQSVRPTVERPVRGKPQVWELRR